MKERSYNSRFSVETLEGRSMMSTVAYADFNNDGLVDKAALTDPTTIVVSLAKADGSYTVSATLKTSKSQPISAVAAWDNNDDGKLDILASGSKHEGSYYSVMWMSNGDGTFDFLEPFRWKHSKNWV